MPLILEQVFPLGRFHATRWNQNPFEDRHGEWPPSPWRLLRALAARWFQYARETGDEDDWNDVEQDEEANIPVVCLLDDKTFTDALSMLKYCKEDHGLDFLGIRDRLRLDFMGCIKLINYSMQ